MLPKVTLLKNYTSYHYIYGNGSYEFKGGIPKSVPVAVALILKKKVNDNNEPLFKVDNLPIVIKNKSEQNVAGKPKPHQLRLNDVVDG